MNIDLTAAEEAVRALKEELGLSDRGSRVGVDIWTFSSGTHELSVNIDIFDKHDHCTHGTGPTWEIAFERCKHELMGLTVDPGAEPVTVVA